MIDKKDFFFVRHGQTDLNVAEATKVAKIDHPFDIELNETGRAQARKIEPVIAKLPVDVVCFSPFTRAVETKSIITSRLHTEHYEIDDLGECSGAVWYEMFELGMHVPPPENGKVRDFIDRVRKGINRVLSLSGTPLIVAHGGIHWAICCLLGIQEHKWAIDNCVPVHFYIDQDSRWAAKILK